jgi:hypothetical protein
VPTNRGRRVCPDAFNEWYKNVETLPDMPTSFIMSAQRETVNLLGKKYAAGAASRSKAPRVRIVKQKIKDVKHR